MSIRRAILTYGESENGILKRKLAKPSLDFGLVEFEAGQAPSFGYKTASLGLAGRNLTFWKL